MEVSSEVFADCVEKLFKSGCIGRACKEVLYVLGLSLGRRVCTCCPYIDVGAIGVVGPWWVACHKIIPLAILWKVMPPSDYLIRV